MRIAYIIAALSVIGPATECWAQQNQPSDQNSYTCGTAENAEQLNARLSRDGLVAKGVEQMTAYCVADIRSLWNACAKSHGAAKRNFWCGQLTSYCEELSRQNNAAQRKRLDEMAKKNEERAKARQWNMQNLPPQVFAATPYETTSLSEYMYAYGTEPTLPDCTGIPVEEGKKRPQSAPARPSSGSDLEMLLNGRIPRANMYGPAPMPMYFPPQPSFDDTPTPRMDFGSSHSNTCAANKMNCINNCNPPSFGQPKNYDAIRSCQAGCERMCQ